MGTRELQILIPILVRPKNDLIETPPFKYDSPWINSYQWNIRGAICFYLRVISWIKQFLPGINTWIYLSVVWYMQQVLSSRAKELKHVFFTVSGGTLLHKCDFETSFCLGKSGPGTVSFFRTQVSILYFSIESQDFQNSRAYTVFRCQCIFTRKRY